MIKRMELRKSAAVMTAIMAVAFVLSSCKEKELKPVDVIITDPYRHYYPVIQGEMLPVAYEIENTSDETLVIQEIQTTCGCITPQDELPIMVLPKKTNTVRLAYNTIKNTGYVEHYVWLYGNFTDSNYRELRFDTNVVPPADYTRDYEVLYHEQQDKGIPSIKDMVDGESANKGYYTDDAGDIRENTRRERQEKADEIVGY